MLDTFRSVDVRLIPKGSNERHVIVRVVDDGNGTPVDGAQVVLLVGGNTYSQSTDSNGIAKFTITFSENTIDADITVSTANHRIERQRVTLRPDEVQDVRLDQDANELTIAAFEPSAPTSLDPSTPISELTNTVSEPSPTPTSIPQPTSTSMPPPTVIPTNTPVDEATAITDAADPSSDLNPLILKPTIALSFQDEGTAGFDDTVLLQAKDGHWAPSQVGTTVGYDYYASGTDEEVFDALTARFDVSGIALEDYTPIFRFYAQHGGLPNSTWQHYLLQEGKENQELNDRGVGGVPQADTIGYTSGKWIEVEVPSDFWTDDVLWLTLRLYNVRVDAVELLLMPVQDSVPTPTASAGSRLSTVVIKPTTAFSFQNEGTAGFDDTVLLQAKDGHWAPSEVGTTRGYDYYASGTNAELFDALSAEFDVSGIAPEDYTAIFRFYAQQGDLPGKNSYWQHYLLQKGKENQQYKDNHLNGVPQAKEIDYTRGKWIEEEVPSSFWTDDVLWLTLRLYNVRVDAVELLLVPIEEVE